MIMLLRFKYIFFHIFYISQSREKIKMPLKKKRTIIIRNPCLRRVRNNLRSLLIQTCGDEQSKIHEEEEKLMLIPDYYDNEDIQKQAKKLNDQYWAIKRPLRESILLCPACFQSDKDMTYNPVRKEWYCTGCYAELKIGFTEEGRPKQFP